MCEYIWFFFFFNDTPTTEIYTYCHTLSLHDALPISSCGFRLLLVRASGNGFQPVFPPGLEHRDRPELGAPVPRSGEMLFPQPADGRGVEQAVGFHSGRIQEMRSEGRRVGKECVSTCRSRWSPYHETKKPTVQSNNTKT